MVTQLAWPLNRADWETENSLARGWEMWARMNPGTCPWLGTMEGTGPGALAGGREQEGLEHGRISFDRENPSLSSGSGCVLMEEL